MLRSTAMWMIMTEMAMAEDKDEQFEKSSGRSSRHIETALVHIETALVHIVPSAPGCC